MRGLVSGWQPRGPVGLAVGMVLLVLAMACSADAPCALGTRGWCEDEMAALVVRTVVGTGPNQVQADEVAVVADGFAVEERRYGGQKVLSVKPDEMESIIARRSGGVQGILVVVSNVQIVSAGRPGSVVAQGTALVGVYQEGRRIRAEVISGRLLTGTWVLGERKVME